MTFAELKRQLSSVAADPDHFLRLLRAVIVDECKSGGSVSIPGLGVFRRGTRKARHITNPRTGERMALPETTTLKFTAAKAAKARLK